MNAIYVTRVLKRLYFIRIKIKKNVKMSKPRRTN